MPSHEMSLMTAKICHDLATPLSAMSLLTDLAFEKSTDPYVESTFRESLDRAVLKIQFFRMLMTVSDGQPAYADVQALILKFANLYKVNVALPNSCPDGIGSRFILGVCIILIESLLRGGVLRVEMTSDSLVFTAQGDPVQLRPGYKDALERKAGIEVNARNILPVYLAELARSMTVAIKANKVGSDTLQIETIADDDV